MTDKNEIIWITGGSSGIGFALVKKFVDAGFNILATSGNKNKLYKAFEHYETKGVLILEKCDLSNVADIKVISDKIGNEYKITGLINNAGVTSFKPFKVNSDEEIDDILNINLRGSIYTIKSVLPGMISMNKGKIINILSVVVHKIFTNSSIYAASKAGLLAFSNVLREEVRKHNIRITNIVPGATATPIWSNDNLSKFSHRMMKPEDIADMVFDLYNTNNSIVPEELTLRPIEGDL